jgi:histone-like transcription factor (CBF/NF-Y)
VLEDEYEKEVASQISGGNVTHFYYIKTRIKRIMQVDDDIGKISSSAPILVCTFDHFMPSESYGAIHWRACQSSV